MCLLDYLVEDIKLRLNNNQILLIAFTYIYIIFIFTFLFYRRNNKLFISYYTNEAYKCIYIYLRNIN